MPKERLKRFLVAAKANNHLSDKVITKSTYFSNSWVTFFAPILIGFGVNYFFSLDKLGSAPVFIWLTCGIFFVVHIFASYVLHQNSSKLSLYSQALEINDDLLSLRSDLARYKWAFRDLDKLKSTQISALRMATHSTDTAVGEIDILTQQTLQGKKVKDEEFWGLMDQHLAAIMYPLISEREALFKYESESRYNIALYFYSEEQNSLNIVFRDCDSRLPQTNRKWKPGLGHVGLAFLHKAVKLCPDMTKSSELNSLQANGDAENYKSFLSMPIMKCNDDGTIDNGIKPLGVVVLTSALAEQFEENRDIPFMSMIVKLLAIFLSSADNYLNRFDYIDTSENTTLTAEGNDEK
ncbi:hypothetical protein ACVBKF_02355 [Shewanella sp. 0m-11]